MPPLHNFPLPLQPDRPPYGYVCNDHDPSASSGTTAFNTSIDARDTFLGLPRCIICGNSSALQHCHISMQEEPSCRAWVGLKSRHWIPPHAKSYPDHEPRNGLLMCLNHHFSFNHYDFFIRYFPRIRKFVFVNYSGLEDLQPYHGKAVALDVGDHHAPYPSLFIIHEMRVRGFHPFQPIQPDMPDDIAWQDWVLSSGLFNHDEGTFRREGEGNSRIAGPQVDGLPMMPLRDDDTSGDGKHPLALNADVIGKIPEATRAMPSWRAREVEGMTWSGTAQENIDKYVSCIGTED